MSAGALQIRVPKGRISDAKMEPKGTKNCRFIFLVPFRVFKVVSTLRKKKYAKEDNTNLPFFFFLIR